MAHESSIVTSGLLPSYDNLMTVTEAVSASAKPGRPAKEIILKQIVHSERKQNNISLVYRESLKTMLRLFNQFFYINSENQLVPVKCVHANPERAIAKLKQETNIILPILSISQTTSEDDPKRRRNDYSMVHEVWWDDVKKRAYRVVSMAPRAVKIKYTIYSWAKYKSDLDQLAEQIRTKFFPSLDIPTTYSEFNPAFLTEEIDQTSVDLGDKEDRILRKAFGIEIHTYIPTAKYLVTSTGEIEKVGQDVILTGNIVS